MAFLTNLILLPLLLLANFSPTPSLCYVSPYAARVHQSATQTSAYHTYIVLVEPPPPGVDEEGHRRWYETFLPSSHIGESGEPRLLHSYTEVFSGFTAKLTEAELDVVAKNPRFVRAFPDQTLQLMTTHTPEFLGLKNGTGFWSDAGYGKGVIVGLLDTGIYASHPSFDDHGVPPPPMKWKGSCKAVRCNNKLIGAKSVVGDDGSYDYDGHGTHTSSIATGNFVTGASDHGVGTGTASGIAPGAHIAMYKVCTNRGCKVSIIMAGMDAAIKDGVDVLSLSLGSRTTVSFINDPIAIGAFSAISKGIIVVCAAGNRGPTPRSITNDAPWLLTVAAGSVDRRFDAGVHLGNGKRIDGEALTKVTKPTSNPYPLLYSEEHRFCQNEDHGFVAGKVIVCQATTPANQYSDIARLMAAGAAGVVLFNNQAAGYTIALHDYKAGVVQVTSADGITIAAYAKSATNGAVATFTYNNTVLGVRPSPVVASFSSRGPSYIAPGVLKPDILAPGLNILAAWPGPSFKIISGTSMATPHVSGVAALIKSLHPDWSPAAIKSAILTTSDVVNNIGDSILNERHGKASAYDRGAGHVNPARAADPGLVYDLGATDYAGYICWLFGDEGLRTIVRNSSLTCVKLPKVKDVQLNYPTLTVPLASTPFTVTRAVTNVGPAHSTYAVKVDSPSSMKVCVSPKTLVFSKAGEKKTFSVTVICQGVGASETFVEGSLSWVSKKHVVRSPIVAVRGAGDHAPAPSP
ncbi:Subtilisin-like protease [Triticum urartu]|uniref:Subtilisin-like protease n=1 Tax=Triticum urartu TaxID=4572 RepID=M7Z2K2_TRIUA|nr:subtilisin-like protease 4 [Triticum urartu]XP_048554593.1 subtilisin-like protease 4 [Triticum urartu]EMS46560.1 Subtilisin-like protease [Triticum urartu]